MEGWSRVTCTLCLTNIGFVKKCDTRRDRTSDLTVAGELDAATVPLTAVRSTTELWYQTEKPRGNARAHSASLAQRDFVSPTGFEPVT